MEMRLAEEWSGHSPSGADLVEWITRTSSGRLYRVGNGACSPISARTFPSGVHQARECIGTFVAMLGYRRTSRRRHGWFVSVETSTRADALERREATPASGVVRIGDVEIPVTEVSYGDSADVTEARGTSPVGSTSGTYHGSFMFSVDSGDTYPVVNRGDLVYASSPTAVSTAPSPSSPPVGRVVGVAADGRALRVEVGAEATAADVVAALTPTLSPSSGYGMAAIYHDFSRARDEQIAQALRSYSQPPTGPTFDDVFRADVFRADITQPTVTFSNDVSAPLTRENLDAVIRQIQQFRSRPDTVIVPSSLSVGDDQAITASPSTPATIRIDEVAVDDAHAEAHQDTIAQMCGFLGRDVAVDDEELRGIAARLDTSRMRLHLVYWPEKRLLKVTTQREVVAARATTRGSLIVIR